MSATMRAVDVKNTTGPATSLFINPETPRPVPTAVQALVRIKAFGLNRMDLLQREGKYPVPPQASKTLGVEFSGVVEELGGEAESGFEKGNEVFGLAYGGAYAEYIVVSTHMLIHKPPHLTHVQAAGIPETWITALQALYFIGRFNPSTGDRSILWHAGASGVSIAGIQLSHAAAIEAGHPKGGDVQVFATARQDDKCHFVERELGATKAFNTTTSDWAKELLNATGGRGADVIIDFIGAPYFQSNLDAAARDARIVNLGAMGGTKLPADVDIGGLLRKRLRVEGSSLRSRDEAYQGRLRDLFVEKALPKFENGDFKVYVEREMSWEDIVEAHQLMESNRTKGKIICTIDW